MCPETLSHLSYFREQRRGRIYITRCSSASGREVAGRLCYVPDAAGRLSIEQQAYRKVALGEPLSDDHERVSNFARDAVYLVPRADIDWVRDPFSVSIDALTEQAPSARALADGLAHTLGALPGGRLGVIGSRLVAPDQPHPGSDVDFGVAGRGAWEAVRQLVQRRIADGSAELLPDERYEEFAARASELRLSDAALRTLRQGQWWRKLRADGALLSFSSCSGLGALPALHSAGRASVEVTALPPQEGAGGAPYVLPALDPSAGVAGALHLSWHLRHGFRGRVTGPVVRLGGQSWVWVSGPSQVSLDTP